MIHTYKRQVSYKGGLLDSKELRAFRRGLGMTQDQMAFLCRVSVRTYRYWEQKEVPSSMQNFLELLRIPENRELMMEMALANAKA